MTEKTQEKVPEKIINTLLSDVTLPGETFRLPTCGLLYDNGELSDEVKNGEVCVYPMTTIDDIRVRTPDKLFSGDAIINVIQRCVPQILKPHDLMGPDVDFLMLCLRQISYDPILEVPFTHTCENAEEYKYKILTTDIVKQTVYVTPAMVKKAFTFNMPDIGKTVHLRLPTFSDTIELMKLSQSDEPSQEELQDLIVFSFLSVIKRVDDVIDRGHIKEWFCALAPKQTKLLKEHLNDMVAVGPNFKRNLKCKDCKKQISFNLPINPVDFFS